MGLLAKFRARTSAERLLFLEAVAWLALSRLAILLLPFRWIAPRLGRHMADTAEFDDPACEELLRRLSWAVAAAARYVPWKAACLSQAMSAKMMLRARRIPSTLYLGVANEGRMTAHAWLRVGSRFVTGGRGSDHHTIISTFA